jgi:hypothetical protein
MLVKDILKNEFGFTPLYGKEFEKLPAYKRELTEMIERKGMDFKIARANFDSSCKATQEYIKETQGVIFGTTGSVRLGVKPRDVRLFFNMVLSLKTDIQDLIDAYNAGE